MTEPSTRSDFSHWYSGDESDSFAPARIAFEEARAIFENDGTEDAKKINRLKEIGATSLHDVLDAVNNAQHYYLKTRTDSRMRRCMEQVSERIYYYGNVMDVFIQQHPEYVSLAWGTMKLLVGGIVEHKKIGSVLANGLLDIADALPHVDLATILYPTAMVKETAARLYAHILRFSLRALKWYEERPWKRAVHSVTKPADLAYNDILDDIQRATRSIATHATAGNQAELRDAHKAIIATRQLIIAGHEKDSYEHMELRRLLINLVGDLRSDIYLTQDQAQKERAQIYRSVSNIEATQALQIMTMPCEISHQSSLQYSRHFRDRRRFTQKTKTFPFWQSPHLHAWNKSSNSLLFVLKVSFSYRQIVQDFSTNVIEQLSLAFQSPGRVLFCHRCPEKPPSPGCHHESNKKDVVLEFVDRFMHAKLEEDYLAVLCGLLQSFPVVYMIIHLEAVESPYATQFASLLKQLTEQLPKSTNSTVLRILILSWRPGDDIGEPGQAHRSKLQVRKASKRKGSRLPTRPLR
ncbi:hypothetical protein N7478_000618 [Penicillium angulare]|uniref:uncharacterized protein n=1 Tax=Penicillium angulare TaxID=116970 RepID=UPI002541238E|nr:uncharacterized protein N7478_000618 [Penicillium angulare]KAJ5291367.1 hypothetical protein N7478_000618 [Penicillium angulare]